MKIPERVLKWINPAVGALLNSRLHGLMSADVMLLTVTGRRSGRTYTQPVSYRREGGIVRCFTSSHTGWWKNLRGGAEVSIRIAGQPLTGRAEATHGDAKRVGDALTEFLVHLPRDAAYYQVAMDSRGVPNEADMERAAQDAVLVEIAVDPRVDVAAEEEEVAVRQALHDWVVASDQPGMAGADGYASFMTEDAVWLPPNAPIQVGRDAIMEEQIQLRMLEDFSFRFDATRVEVSAAGDLACGIGTAEMSFTDPAGGKFHGLGKFMDIWRKQPDGSWKCIAGMHNSNRPAEEDEPLLAASLPEPLLEV